jgi:very-short-patch-repair endonuclease
VSSGMNTIAKILRKRLTDTEKVLWRHLRAKQVEGHKFRRQEPIGKYIVDFVCHEKRIIIELDGGQHSIDKDRDIERDEWLTGQGYKILRFWNNEVLTNIDGVLEVIKENCLKHPPLTPPIKGGQIRRDPQKSLKNQI